MIRRLIASNGLVLALTALLASVASANVSLKNGNFFMAYTDLLYPGGFETKVERVYNSKTSYQGFFGFGWGSEYEVQLKVSADGSVVVHEYGGGAENRFIPVAFKAEELQKAVDAIAAEARKAGMLASQAAYDTYRSKLKGDADFRNDEWEKFRSKLPPRKVPTGSQLQSNKFSYQYITKVADGYVRSFDTGRVEKFNDSGKLVRISDKNNNFINLSYGKDGNLQSVIDNFNRKLFFHFSTHKLLEKVTGDDGKVATYTYSKAGELASSKDVEGSVFTYKYDARHNLTEIGYKDKTTQAMTYYGPDKYDNIKSVKDRQGNLTEYGYDFDQADPNHYTVSVKVKGSDGKPISSSSYEYFVKRKADGEEWTYKMVTVIDGDRTETIYNECCGLPLIIKHGTEETNFEYDTKGHVTKKATPTEVTEMTYDAKVNKINRVVKYPKGNKNQTTWSTFQYDDKGNLVFAKNSDSKGVRLFYDGNGRIKSMVDQNKRQINFKYNEHSKPIEISDPSLGTITVSYTNTGEIKKVESSAGRKIALEVTAAFQNLLDIIRPAGVSLSF